MCTRSIVLLQPPSACNWTRESRRASAGWIERGKMFLLLFIGATNKIWCLKSWLCKIGCRQRARIRLWTAAFVIGAIASNAACCNVDRRQKFSRRAFWNVLYNKMYAKKVILRLQPGKIAPSRGAQQTCWFALRLKMQVACGVLQSASLSQAPFSLLACHAW